MDSPTEVCAAAIGVPAEMKLTAAPPSRQLQRERERLARLRRKSKLADMRATVDVLERAALVTHTLDSADAGWEDFLDPDSINMRRILRLAKEARALQLEQAQLQRLLEEHRPATRILSKLVLEDQPVDDWEDKVHRWRELTRRNFRPWTLEECDAEMDVALKAVNSFEWSIDKQTSGMSFMGWRESRHFDAARGVLKFQFHKTYHGYDIMDAVNAGWDTYTVAEKFKEVILGHRARGCHEVLQQRGPNLVLFHTVQHFKVADVDAHIVDILFRVKTESGFLQCLRAVCCPELMKVIDSPTDMWASNFMWLRWDELPGGARGYRLYIGGVVEGADPTYLNQWMMEIFGCVLRSEYLATRRNVIMSE